MKWEQIRVKYPNKWVLFEAIQAHSSEGKRIVDETSIINFYDDSREALRKYKELHLNDPFREFYVAHTTKTELDIIERKWLGIRI